MVCIPTLALHHSQEINLWLAVIKPSPPAWHKAISSSPPCRKFSAIHVIGERLTYVHYLKHANP